MLEGLTRLYIGLASVDHCRAWEAGQLGHDVLHSKQPSKGAVWAGQQGRQYRTQVACDMIRMRVLHVNSTLAHMQRERDDAEMQAPSVS